MTVPVPGPAVPPAAITPQAITAAALALRNGHIEHGARLPASDRRALAKAILKAAAPHLAAAGRQRLYAELGNDHHVIFTEDGWTVEHSVECRLSGWMHRCAYHTAVARVADEYDPRKLGRWRIDGIDGWGLPCLARADDQPADLLREQP